MTNGEGLGTNAASSAEAQRLPSPSALVGVWARATLNVWGLAFDWWKVLLEFGYAEDPRLGVWSTTVYFPRCERDITVEPLSLTTGRGDVVPGAQVAVNPTLVERNAGQGNKELQVSVRRVPPGLRHHFILTIRAREDSTIVQQYGLDFGVPGAAV